MKVLHKKIKIGDYRGAEVYVDWKYLAKDMGLKKEEDIFQNILGRFLFLIGVIGFAGLFLYEFTLGDFLISRMVFIKALPELISWILISFILYSFYMRRSREKFYDTLDLKAVSEFRKELENGRRVKQIEILDFVDHDVLNLLDDVIRSNDENIYSNLMTRLIKLGDTRTLLSRLGIKPEELQKKVQGFSVESRGEKTYQVNRLLFQSFALAEKYGFSYIGEWVVFLKLALDEYQEVFRELNVQRDALLAVLEWSKAEAVANRYRKLWKYKASLKPGSTVNRSYTSAYTATLNKYSRDLTRNAAEGEFLYAIAREDEISQIIRHLRQQGKASVLLVGEPGVGKSTILQSIAVKMVVEDVPKELKDKRLVEFNFQKAIAEAKSTNELRRVLDKIFVEVAKSMNVVLVIDDLDELVNVREEIAGEIIATISKALDRNRVKIIATTSRMGYSRSIKPNSALSSMFDIVEISEPAPDIAMQILFDERGRLEERYGIKILFEAVSAAVELSVHYDTTRLLPLKAIDALEDACVLALEEGLSYVDKKEVEAVISKDAGIKVGSLSESEGAKLLKLEEIMHKRVVGQDKAVQAVAAALRRARAGLTGKSKPIASFLFFGPTGVGKTEVARTLAAVYYGDEKLVTRLDMSEFQEGENVKRLIGYMQGDDFVGGQLTEKVRSNPFSLVLLDEIEKANPQVLDLFLQVLDEGHITDGIGRKVDFKNTIIITTSNIGSSEIAKSLEAGNDYEQTFRVAQAELKKKLRLEFINRFDKVIMFKPLNKVEIEKVADLMMKKLAGRLAEQGIELTYNDSLLSELAQKGYSAVFGAREMNRVIQDEVETQIADLIVSGKLKSGGRVKMEGLGIFIIN